MTDRRISELTAATTPLSGTEEAVIVQDGESRRVPVASLGAPPWAPSALAVGGVKRIGNRTGFGSIGSQAVSPGWLYVHHYEPASIEVATGMGVEVTTAIAGGALMLGLWAVQDQNTLALVIQAGPLDLSTTGFKVGSFANLTLDRRDYFVSTSVSLNGGLLRSEQAMRGAMWFEAGQSDEAYFPSGYSTTLPATVTVSNPSGYRSQRPRVFLTGV
jgi:hypothetical protein